MAIRMIALLLIISLGLSVYNIYSISKLAQGTLEALTFLENNQLDLSSNINSLKKSPDESFMQSLKEENSYGK